MKKITLFIALAFACATASAAQSQWSVDKKIDKMTDEVSVRAQSPFALNTEDGFGASLAVDCDGDIILFAGASNSIDSWDVNGGEWNVDTFRVRWAANSETGAAEVKGEEFVFQVWGSPPDQTIVKLADARDKTIKRIKTHPSVLVEIPFRINGKKYFDINLVNAKAAIAEMEKECAALK